MESYARTNFEGCQTLVEKLNLNMQNSLLFLFCIRARILVRDNSVASLVKEVINLEKTETNHIMGALKVLRFLGKQERTIDKFIMYCLNHQSQRVVKETWLMLDQFSHSDSRSFAMKLMESPQIHSQLSAAEFLLKSAEKKTLEQQDVEIFVPKFLTSANVVRRKLLSVYFIDQTLLPSVSKMIMQLLKLQYFLDAIHLLQVDKNLFESLKLMEHMVPESMKPCFFQSAAKAVLNTTNVECAKWIFQKTPLVPMEITKMIIKFDLDVQKLDDLMYKTLEKNPLESLKSLKLLKTNKKLNLMTKSQKILQKLKTTEEISMLISDLKSTNINQETQTEIPEQRCVHVEIMQLSETLSFYTADCY